MSLYERLAAMSEEQRLDTLENLPSFLANVGQKDRLVRLLTDLCFAEAKCASGPVYDLLSDFDLAKSIQSHQVMQVRQSIIQCLRAIMDRPELCLQTLYNQLSGISLSTPGLGQFLERRQRGIK